MAGKNMSTMNPKLESNLIEVNALEPWPEPVDGGLLLNDLRRTLTRFVVLPQWGAEALALWTLHTYAFELREVGAYVGIESPEKRCGKTTLVAALSELVSRPEVAANISPPAFFRVIEETRPTLLIDEADTLLPGNDALRGILNSGYKRRTSYVVRVNSQGSGVEGPMGLARFSCWCPKLISTIGSLPETLADRCIVVRMHRKTASERCERLRELDGETLRRCCLRFVADRAAEIAGARPEIPAGLNDRAGDIWEPLLALADLAGGEWPKGAREAAVGLSGGSQENGPIGSLLLDMVVAFATTGAERMFSRDVVERLEGMGSRPWEELRKGRAISEIWLAWQLRPYGLRPRTMWIGEAAAKGYVGAEVMEAARRYVSRAELEELGEGMKGGG